MTSEERLRILEMVAEGKLTTDEADELLGAMEPAPQPTVRAAFPSPMLPLRPAAPPQRYLAIRVMDGDQAKVNVRIPLGLARGAAKWLGNLTEQVQSSFDLNVKDLVESLGDAPSDGTVIDLHDGGTTVWIGIESVAVPQHGAVSAR